MLIPHKENKREKTLYIYINKDRNSSTKSSKHVEANVNTRKESQNNQTSTKHVQANVNTGKKTKIIKPVPSMSKQM
jgi:hypothetical protein